MITLPVDAHLPELVERLRGAQSLVLQAEPGAGKTTRVPPALLPLISDDKLVVVLEPRRLAARMAARRVAEEMGTRVGELVGYQVRFEDVVSAATRVKFVTEGVLTRQLAQDPNLSRVGAVVLDEFHERHLQTDVALGLLARLQRSTRRDLKLVVMSATMDAGPVARFLGDCPQMKVPGRVFPVEVEYAAKEEPAQNPRPLERQVADAVRRLLEQGLDGDVLVFLPGAAEIRAARAACTTLAQQHDLLMLPLHGDLTPEEQDQAVRPSRKRKLILSTNVAETSVTIDGVVAIIDSGLARIAGHASWSGLATLKLGRISRASATQRAGRAGRTRPGRCIRLYTRHDHDTRPEHTPPEVKRMDLSETALLLHGMGERDLAAFPWFETPDASQLQAASSLLRLLNAVTPEGVLTPTGKDMLRFPLHPRQARVLVEAVARGFRDEGCVVAALLGEVDIWASERRGLSTTTRSRKKDVHGSDVLAAWEAFETARAGNFNPRDVEALGLDPGVVSRVERVRKQLAGIARNVNPPRQGASDEDTALGMAILAGYADRVAQRRKGPAARADVPEFLLATGGTARLAPWSQVADSPLLVALDAEDRTGGKQDGVRISRASAIEPEWLLDVVPDALQDSVDVEWNAQAQRVDCFSRLRLFQLVLEETRVDHSDDPRVAETLAKAALSMGVAAFCDPEELEHLRARIGTLREIMPELGFPSLDDNALKDAMRRHCEGRRTIAELKEVSFVDTLVAELTPAQRQALEAQAPQSIRLPGGRKCTVHYVAGQPPWVESRLQDFFGMREAPRIMNGRQKLNMHLLAPNQRAVQITDDLAGFWQRHYPAIRKELMRKYPRHSWPEDPVTATPPQPGQRARSS
ncbi:MAG: ATP-dependent helicase HrpB [Myxococcota bacterium]